jgi:tryptophan synthase alpha chain
MNQLGAAFARLKREGKRGFIPFITAGDPDLETTAALLVELASAGATAIELGVPFSDPVADGPVIQRASERALKHGFGIEEILQTVASVRERVDSALVLFSYFNPLLQFGIDRLASEASASGIDGILATDLTPEEASEFVTTLRAKDLDTIFLAAPTSTEQRLQLIASKARGFIYAISRAGVTGTRPDVSAEAKKLVARVRRFSDLPVAVGFGISTSEQVAETWTYADAAVVGSAIVAEIENLSTAPDLVQRIGDFARRLQPESDSARAKINLP